VPSDGGIKPCVSSFGADQFDDSDAGKRRRKSSFFNWFYFSINVDALVASSVLVYVQTHVGWGMGLRHPRHRHRRRRDIFPGRAALQATGIAQVLIAAARKWRVPTPRRLGRRPVQPAGLD
jgi:peptide/histidine transporter 3/4